MDNQTDWQPFDEQDPSTHPQVNSLVEFEYSNGRRYTVHYFSPVEFSATAARFNEMAPPIPGDTILLEKQWRYVREE